MKKLFLYILVICFTFCLTSCGNEKDIDTSSNDSQTVSTNSETDSSKNEIVETDSSETETVETDSSEETESIKTPENNTSVELTTSNFDDYFFITFSVENCHGEYPGPGLFSSLCDLRVFIDSKTSKHPENVTVTIRIEEIEYDGWSLPWAPITTKTLLIPYNGSTQFSVPLQKNVVGGDLEIPEVKNFKYIIQEISGTVK